MREWSVGYEVANYVMQSMETGEVINSDNHLDLSVRAVYINLFTLGLMNTFTNSAFVSAVTLVSSPVVKHWETYHLVSIRHLVACSVLFQCQ